MIVPNGISIRDYFITHAPPCPEWFVSKTILTFKYERPREPEFPWELTIYDKVIAGEITAHKWSGRPLYNPLTYEGEWVMYLRACEQYNEDKRIRAQVEWPIYWADEVMKLKKELKNES